MGFLSTTECTYLPTYLPTLPTCAVHHLLNRVSTVATAVAALCRYRDNTVVISDFIHDQMVLRLDLEWRMRL